MLLVVLDQLVPLEVLDQMERVPEKHVDPWKDAGRDACRVTPRVSGRGLSGIGSGLGAGRVAADQGHNGEQCEEAADRVALVSPLSVYSDRHTLLSTYVRCVGRWGNVGSTELRPAGRSRQTSKRTGFVCGNADAS